MRIAILTFGTRGDVQPYAVLGDHLRQRGHDVRFTVAENLIGMFEAADLPAAAIPIDSQEFMSSREGREILSAGGTTKFLKELGRRETLARDGFDAAVLEACDDADVIVASILLLARAWQVVERSRQRLVPVFTMPIQPTREYASPFLTRPHLPVAPLRAATHHVFEAAYWLGARSNTASMRTRVGLRGAGPNPIRALRKSGQPVYHLISPALLQPSDWPAHTTCVGAPRVPAHLRTAWDEDQIDPDLDAWLDAGDPPVYFGYGSMPVLDPGEALARVTSVAATCGVRALIGAGWSEIPHGPTDDGRAFVTAAFDHEAVLPRCVAAVHHGGAGTTHTVLRAGLPAVVTHVFADQILWAALVERRGWGTSLAYQRATVATLTAALRPLLTPAAARRTAEGGRIVAADDPLSAMTAAIGGA